MMKICWISSWMCSMAVAAGVLAGDLAGIDRTIKREPAYESKAPRYALLVFGPEAKDRVWLVHDGANLYVDREGTGDLTGPGNKVTATVDKNRDPDDISYQFEAGELRVGGRVHKCLSVSAGPLTNYGKSVQQQPNAKAALAADPRARLYSMSLDVDMPGLKGPGTGGHVMQIAGVVDAGGALLFGASPATAPVIHFGGPLQVTFYGEKPILKLERPNDVVLVVGTPGHGPGSFAEVAYEDTIPAAAIPKVEILFPAMKAGAPQVRELFELRQRC